MTFQVTLATPDKVFFDGLATGIICPGLGGSFGVLARHTRMLTALTTGILRIQEEGHDKFFLVDGGMVVVGPDGVELLADHVIPARDAADAEQELEKLRGGRIK